MFLLWKVRLQFLRGEDYLCFSCAKIFYVFIVES